MKLKIFSLLAKALDRSSGLIIFKGSNDSDASDKGDTGSPWYSEAKQLLKLSPVTPVIKRL